MGVLALVGTRKGLFIARGDDARRRWHVEGPLLAGWGVYHATVDGRNGTIYVAANHVVYGPTVQRSVDGGMTWARSRKLALPDEFGLTVNALWYIEPGRPEEPETLYLGGDPAVLFRSDDGGQTWDAVRSILEHPTRDRWLPSRGGLSLHSIQLDPSDRERMYVAMSSGGTFRTDDGGRTWRPMNRDVAADYLPDPYPEVGQCPHKLLLHPQQPARLWQQNHCGVYRSDDSGEHWERVDENGLPSPFGFPIMLDPANPDVAVVIPERSYEYHYTPDGRLGVYKTDDRGKSWACMSNGLPELAWVSVLRNASAFDRDSLYFGTDGGSFFSLAPGGHWIEAVQHLPPILSIEVTSWSEW
jgi:photosystem II stability/assembly factor-like uncharacterized protein